jgi:hypothetical protein
LKVTDLSIAEKYASFLEETRNARDVDAYLARTLGTEGGAHGAAACL